MLPVPRFYDRPKPPLRLDFGGTAAAAVSMKKQLHRITRARYESSRVEQFFSRSLFLRARRGRGGKHPRVAHAIVERYSAHTNLTPAWRTDWNLCVTNGITNADLRAFTEWERWSMLFVCCIVPLLCIAAREIIGKNAPANLLYYTRVSNALQNIYIYMHE